MLQQVRIAPKWEVISGAILKNKVFINWNLLGSITHKSYEQGEVLGLASSPN